jgi:hypothetical protein
MTTVHAPPSLAQRHENDGLPDYGCTHSVKSVLGEVQHNSVANYVLHCAHTVVEDRQMVCAVNSAMQVRTDPHLLGLIHFLDAPVARVQLLGSRSCV